MKKRTLINLVLIAVIIFCGYKLTSKLYAYKKSENTIVKVQSMKSSADDSLSSQNEDFRFWMNINNTKIDYPVLQGKDNDFYLKHDFFKKESISGSIFLDYRVNSESKNSIIYGHNMRNGSMFKDIELFKNKEFFNNNKFIKINKDGKEYLYKVFSVYYISGENTDYLKTNFDSDADFAKYLDNVKSKSLFNNDEKLSLNDILTLSTCSYEGENFRTVVHAQLIEEK